MGEIWGVPISAVTLMAAAVGIAVVLGWVAARLLVKVVIAAGFVAACAITWWLVTGQGPVEMWQSVQDYVSGAIAGIAAGRQS